MKKLFNIKGLNFWVVTSGIGFNLIWSVAILVFTANRLTEDPSFASTAQLIFIAAAFLGCMFTGWFSAWMAADGRGPTYGIITSLGAALPFGIILIPSGITGLLVTLVALAGGLNGGLLSLRR